MPYLCLSINFEEKKSEETVSYARFSSKSVQNSHTVTNKLHNFMLQSKKCLQLTSCVLSKLLLAFMTLTIFVYHVGGISLCVCVFPSKFLLVN